MITLPAVACYHRRAHGSRAWHVALLFECCRDIVRRHFNACYLLVDDSGHCLSKLAMPFRSLFVPSDTLRAGIATFIILRLFSAFRLIRRSRKSSNSACAAADASGRCFRALMLDMSDAMPHCHALGIIVLDAKMLVMQARWRVDELHSPDDAARRFIFACHYITRRRRFFTLMSLVRPRSMNTSQALHHGIRLRDDFQGRFDFDSFRRLGARRWAMLPRPILLMRGAACRF